MVKFGAFVFLMCLFCNGCLNYNVKLLPLTLTRQSKPFNNFKNNGYYYINVMTHGNGIVDVFYFYQNGVYYRHIGGAGQDSSKSLEELDDFFRHRDTTKNEIKSRNRNADGWGVYRVDSSILSLQGWYVEGKCYTYIQKGNIINDSTIVLQDFLLNPGGAKVKWLSGTIKFREFSPKPDSTNRFIK